MPKVATFCKEEKLHKAMQVFWEHGYSGTSMQDLVDATRLNRSSLYNSYGDKMALYKECLAAYICQTQDQLSRAIAQAQDSLQAIQLIFESFLPEISKDNRGCMSMNCKSEMNAHPSIKLWLETTQDTMISMFQQLIKTGQKEGSINKNKSCRSYAYHIMSAFQGYRMTGILVKEEKVLKDIIDSSLSILK